MLYSILIYGSEDVLEGLSEEAERDIIEKHRAWQKETGDSGRLGPFVRLMPTTTAMTVCAERGQVTVMDGPFAETKEQLIGSYVFECETLEEAVSAAKRLPTEVGSIEVRPIQLFGSGVLRTSEDQ